MENSGIDFSFVLFLLAIFWIGQSIAVAVIASSHRKRPGMAWFVLSIAVIPVMAVLLLIASPVDPRERVQCSNCGELIIADANVCHYCGKTFSS